jgi:ankyrin repeat protein
VLHHLAAKAQQIELADLQDVLVDYQPALAERDAYGNTCLHFAAGSGASLAQLRAFASAGAPMKLANHDGQTFLHALNVKLYKPDTLAPIIEWAVHKKDSMTKRDSRNRTVWHTIFQRGVNLEMFNSILPYLWPSKDEVMMMLDDDGHTPLDCLRSYWTSTNVDLGIDLLNLLQSSGILPIFFAANQTAPVHNTVRDRASVRLSRSPQLSAGVSRLTVGAPTRHDADELKSTYINVPI